VYVAAPSPRWPRLLNPAGASPTQDTAAWYAGTRAKVEARATLGRAEDLWRVLEDVRERMKE
jgi:hypothetical protein